MLTGIDHIVIVVPDLPAAVRDYTELGFTVVEGGRHPVGTHNGLISLADGAYIELIGFYEPNPDHRWWQPLQAGGGFVDFCMRTDDLAGDTTAFRKAGVDIGDPVPQSRRRPDGYELQWVFSLARGRYRGVAPFIIQDVTPRDERVPRETKHPNRVEAIASVTIAVSDLNNARRWYSAALGKEGQQIVREDLQAEGVSFSAGAHALEIVGPWPLPVGGPAESLREWVDQHGPSPHSAILRAVGRERGPLDRALSHGAVLVLV